MTTSHQPYERPHSVTDPQQLVTYIFPDFKAVKYFEKDFKTSNEFHIIEESTSSGFDIYFVEQWICNRKIGTIISTFTGNLNQHVSVIKFTTLRKQTKHYPLKFQEYLNEQFLCSAKFKRMDHEESEESSYFSNGQIASQLLLVTNITALPSDLNLIPILCGDSRIIEERFVINSNLKKLQCCGRSLSMTADRISDANEDKFRQMYKIYNPDVPISFAMEELINIIQICLFYFDLLDARYCDGLLCSKTEEAILNWWNLIGLPHYNFKANSKSGILPSTTVAAIIGLLLSIKIRLQIVGGCDVPKDPFDFENFMISIGQFQKQYKLDKRRKLDLETLSKLFAITNAKLLPDTNKINHNLDRIDSADETGTLSLAPSNSRAGYTSSFVYPKKLTSPPSKKTKNYYSKEFKKLTNVVKNTVQDHIVGNISEDNNSNPKSSSMRIRNRIAKLADTVSPLDVEILDLEILVKNYLTGKTLTRLWHGISNASETSKNLNEYDTKRQYYRHRHRRGSVLNNNSLYAFISLYDKISYNQESGSSSNLNDISRYSRGIQKMKVGLQNTGLLGANQNKRSSDLINIDQTSSLSHQINADMLDNSLMRLHTRKSEDEGLNIKSNQCEDSSDNLLRRFNTGLNRRNSFPSCDTSKETNLNIIEFKRNENLIVPECLTRKFGLQRSLSFSSIEESILRPETTLVTPERLSNDYLRTMDKLIKFDRLKKLYNENSTSDKTLTNYYLLSSYKQMNIELIKFSNIHNQAMAYKSRILDAELSDKLKYHIDNLTSTIDRLSYETRIVTKRINELEESSKIMQLRLQDQCVAKLNRIIDNLIYSSKFKEVFKEPKERNEIIFKLTGKESKELDYSKMESNRKGSISSIFRSIAIFLYELFVVVLQLLKIDKYNMNLDRIRNNWKKVDPNREIINSAYNFIGKPPQDKFANIKEEKL